MLRHPRCPASRSAAIAARAAVIVGIGAILSACSQLPKLGLDSASDPAAAAKRMEAAHSRPPASTELEKAVEYWAKEHAKQPRDGKAALAYARNLKAMNRKPEALAVLQSSYIYNSQDREYLSEFGRLALEGGHPQLAQQLLERADDPARPDWRVLSARGAALAKQGQYKAAIPLLERARQIAPTRASVLNNLAMAYTMDGQADRGAELLRQAVGSSEADDRVQQNLALVMALKGQTGEAVPPVAEAPQKLPASSLAPAAQPAVARVPVAAVRDPDAVITKAIAAEAAKERARALPIATSTAASRR